MSDRPEPSGAADASNTTGARDHDEPGTTPDIDLDQADPDEYESVGPSSKEGMSITIPALIVALALVIYAIVYVAMR